MMTGADRQLDQQIHDAYENVRLSDDAQDRILANLLAAQANRAVEPEEPAGKPDEEPTEEQTPVMLMRPRKLRWQVVLPAAAAIVAVILVVTLPKLFAPESASQIDMMVSLDERTDVKSDEISYMSEESFDREMPLESAAPADEEALQNDAFEGSSAVGDGALAPERELHTVDHFPFIELPDGTMLSALIDGMTTKEVKPDQVGERVGEGKAYMAEVSTPGASCTVYRLKDHDDGYAVRYDDEESYWYCYEL